MSPPFPFAFWGAAVPAPVITSLNYTQGDTSGGGQSIVITGLHFTGATGVTFGGTSATGVVVNSDTQITCTLPAHTVGAAQDVVVTTPGGTSTGGTGIFEYWSPANASGCSLFCDANYSGTLGGSGTWTARVGTNPTSSSAPAASGGCPVFDGTHILTGPTVGSLFDFVAPCNMTVAVVMSATAAAAHNSSLDQNIGILGDNARGALDVSFNANGFSLIATDGTYKESVTAFAADGGKRCAVGRFADSAFLQTSVNNSAFTAHQTAFSSYSTGTTQALNIGSNFSTGVLNNATLNALVTYSTILVDADCTKIYKWAQQKWGVT